MTSATHSPVFTTLTPHSWSRSWLRANAKDNAVSAQIRSELSHLNFGAAIKQPDEAASPPRNGSASRRPAPKTF